MLHKIIRTTLCTIIMALTVIAVRTPSTAAPDNPKSRVNFYIEKYDGRVDPATFPLAERARNIFSRVRAVADKRGTRPPHLRIVNSLKDPWAISLPDGFIVLSKGTVELCYRGASKELGDARLAFILGHELGHLAEDDFWHLETFMALSGDPEYADLKNILQESSDVPGAEAEHRLAVARGKELKADDRGFLYSALAGFRVDMLVNDEQDDFFTYWNRQTPHAHNDRSHPSARERAGFLRARLQSLHQKIDLFRFGVRLAHFGRYDDAIPFFQEFLKTFPGRETFNNLGYCYLHRAMELMGTKTAYLYWLPTILDSSTRASGLRTRGSSDLSDQAKELLLTAADCFQKACDADPGYTPSRINLAATCLYLDEIYRARAAIEAARKIAPDNVDVLGLRALIIAREDPLADMWPQAMKILDGLLNTPEPHPAIRYNRAVLLEERGRKEEARKTWRELAADEAQLTEPFRANVLKGAGIQQAPIATPSPGPADIKWTAPVSVGTNLLEDEEALQKIAGWSKELMPWIEEEVDDYIYRNGNGTALLTRDGYVDLIVIPAPKSCTVQTLYEAADGSLQKDEIAGGTLYNHEDRWAALTREGQVVEIWIAGS